MSIKIKEFKDKLPIIIKEQYDSVKVTKSFLQSPIEDKIIYRKEYSNQLFETNLDLDEAYELYNILLKLK